MAASGLPLTESDSLDHAATRRGEQSHHLLQALCRASVRKSSSGEAGACRAFLITSVGEIDDVLQTNFPGLTVLPWQAVAPAGYVSQAMDYLDRLFSDPAVVNIRKKDLRTALGMSKASNLSRDVLEKDVFQHFIADAGLEIAARGICRSVSRFDPIEDAGAG
ncbi:MULTISPECIES: hypothetical protein [unclassified Novosphingobium]|uniref:hypothetical protein n=1 Tax=unclassified Novosphingobium TaxID=2644732 RepID=UPI0025DCB7A5|nr:MULTISPECIES: hypothetical protein [unclassified Novosphingobium]